MYTTDRTLIAQLKCILYMIHFIQNHLPLSSRTVKTTEVVDAALSYTSVHLQHSGQIAELLYIMNGYPVFCLCKQKGISKSPSCVMSAMLGAVPVLHYVIVFILCLHDHIWTALYPAVNCVGLDILGFRLLLVFLLCAIEQH